MIDNKGGDFLGRAKKSIQIKAPPEKVWKMLALDRLPEWMNFEIVEYTTEVSNPKDKYRLGETALGTPEGGPPNNCHFEITESLEHEKFTYRLWEKVGGMLWYRGTLGGLITYTLEPVKAGTRFTYEVGSEIHWGILGKIIQPFSLWYARKIWQKALEKLKNILEK